MRDLLTELRLLIEFEEHHTRLRHTIITDADDWSGGFTEGLRAATVSMLELHLNASLHEAYDLDGNPISEWETWTLE